MMTSARSTCYRRAFIGAWIMLLNSSTIQGIAATQDHDSDLIVPLQEASPRLRFHTGGVGRDGQPLVLSELPNIPGSASPWYLAQWQQVSYLMPSDLKPAPAGTVRRYQASAADGHSALTIDQRGHGYSYTLRETDGKLTSGGGANLFLVTQTKSADFGSPIFLEMSGRLTEASISYATSGAKATGAVQAMAFVGLGLKFDGAPFGVGDKFVFMQVPVTVSRSMPDGPGYICQMVDGTPQVVLYGAAVREEPFVRQTQVWTHHYDLSSFVKDLVAKPYSCSGHVRDWPQPQRDPSHWHLAGLYVGLEVQNRDFRGGIARSQPQGHALEGLEIDKLSVRRGT